MPAPLHNNRHRVGPPEPAPARRSPPRRRSYLAFVMLLALLASACQKPEVIVLIGPSAIVAPGVAALADSVIVISGSNFRAVGLRKDIPIPQDSERVDLSGKFVLPVAGGRIAPGEPASLEIHDGSPAGPVIRRMKAGTWVPLN